MWVISNYALKGIRFLFRHKTSLCNMCIHVWSEWTFKMSFTKQTVVVTVIIWRVILHRLEVSSCPEAVLLVFLTESEPHIRYSHVLPHCVPTSEAQPTCLWAHWQQYHSCLILTFPFLVMTFDQYVSLIWWFFEVHDGFSRFDQLQNMITVFQPHRNHYEYPLVLLGSKHFLCFTYNKLS